MTVRDHIGNTSNFTIHVEANRNTLLIAFLKYITVCFFLKITQNVLVYKEVYLNSFHDCYIQASVAEVMAWRQSRNGILWDCFTETFLIRK